MDFIERSWFKPIPVTVLVITVVFGWLLIESPKGILSQSGDEMLTAERSREMLLLGRSVVHFNFEPSFEKPPLQYWLTSLALPRFSNKTLAVRIWPWIYGVLTAVSLAWLAAIVAPGKRWLIPLAVTLLAAVPLFLTDASRGLLDSGLAFFTTMAIAFAELARRNPVYWVSVAIACLFASLQKLPLTFLVWLLILAVRFTSPGERSNLRSGWLAFSISLTLVTMLIWPVFQGLQHPIPIRQLFHQEVVDHLGPERLGRNPYYEIPYRFAVTSASGLFLLLAPCAILIWKRANFDRIAKELSLVILLLVAIEVVSGFRHVRYLEPIIPVLCLLLATVLYRVVERRPAMLPVVACVVLILFVAGIVQTELQIRIRRVNLADERRVAEELGRLQKPGTSIVLVKAVKTGNDLSFGSFYLFHGNLGFPITKLTAEEIKKSAPPPPAIGACVSRDFSAVQTAYPTVKTQFTRAGFIVWQAE